MAYRYTFHQKKRRFGLGIKKASTDHFLVAEELWIPVRRHFKNNRKIAWRVDDIFTADLVEMSSFSNDDKGLKIIMSFIDVLSKYGWLITLENKKDVTILIQKLFTSSSIPQKVWTDKDTEFYITDVRKLHRKHDNKLVSI